MHKHKTRKLPSKLQIKVSACCASMCTYRIHSQDIERSEMITLPVNIVQQCSPVTTTKTDQRTETEKDRIPSRKTKKMSKQTNRRDNRSKQSPHLSIHNKRTVLSETMRRYKDLQLRANWIPGGHLRFQVLNSSAKCRSFTSSSAKCLSRTACVMQKSCKNLENQNSLVVQSDNIRFSPSSDCN